MKRQHQFRRSQLRKPGMWRPALESLEVRFLLCSSGGLPGQDLGGALGTFPAVDGSLAVSGPVAALTAGQGGATASPGAVPALSSLPGAAASLYLDFDGHFEAQWGGYSNITTPAFDQDGDPTTFSAGELATMTQIWQYVAEDYAPLRINVTTVQPPSFANGVALRVAIGGDGAWTGGRYGGIAYVDSFTNSIANTVYVFPANLGNGNARYVADASSHESGHGFGLQHQSEYVNGVKVNEYYAGPGDGRAPLMGNSYSATRSLWWYGTSSVSATTYQDDLAVMARAANGFGYRPDDHGDTAGTATPLAVSGNQVNGSGIITTTADRDFFSFSTGAGPITLAVDVPAPVNNLDARLELRDATGATLLASADPSGSFSATISLTVPAGSYRLVVASHGSYGDLGQYTVRGTIVPSVAGINAPTGLSATAVAVNRINLAWTDNATNEIGYTVQRSVDGVVWNDLATLPADSTTYADTSVAAGATWSYRVQAFNAVASSDYSNTSTATTVPLAPTGLAASAVSASQINLTWADGTGETGYKVERSLDGVSWAQAGTTAANVTSYQDTGLAGSTTYYYRVTATNAGGDSAPSGVATATTPAGPTLPAAPSGLVATAVSGRQVNLTWQDNATNETGFLLQRSSNNGRSWTQVASLGANVTAYTDQTVSPRKTYLYRVRAVNAAGNSAWSNVARVTTPRAGDTLPGLTTGTQPSGTPAEDSPALPPPAANFGDASRPDRPQPSATGPKQLAGNSNVGRMPSLHGFWLPQPDLTALLGAV